MTIKFLDYSKLYYFSIAFSDMYSNYTTLGDNLKSLNLKKLSGIFHYSLYLYRYTANLLKIWKVYNYADWILDFSMLYSFSIANFRIGGNFKKSKFIKF